MRRTRGASSTASLDQWHQIANSFAGREYRDAFVEQLINEGVPAQIRALRLQRGWSQRELGKRAPGGDIAQGTISLLEDPAYEGRTLKTLLRLASAFGVGLAVRFVALSDIVDLATDGLAPEGLVVPSYADDERLHATPSSFPRDAVSTGSTGHGAAPEITVHTAGAARVLRLPGPTTEERFTDLTEVDTIREESVA